MILKKLKSAFSKTNERPPIKTGLLKQYHHRQGYGFIHLKGSNRKVFVHYTDLKDQVKAGDRVRFEMDITPLGCKARRVQRANL